MRIFLDANVLFTAAHNPTGKASFLFEPTYASRWPLMSSAYAIEEARRNLTRKRPMALDRLDALVRALAITSQPTQHRGPALDLLAKDLPIWSAAWAAKSTHLLTGDLRDFGPHMNRPELSGGIVIQTVAEFLVSFSD